MNIQKFTHQQLLDMPLDRPLGEALQNEDACERRSQGLAMAGRDQAQFGIWEASVGTFQREIDGGEIMCILSGHAVFTDESGHSVEMHGGDTLVLAPHTKGTWVIKERLRKLYVIV